MGIENPANESGTSPSTETDAPPAAAADALPLDGLAAAADPALAGLAASAQPQLTHDDSDSLLGQGSTSDYDSHVALVLDPSVLPDMDATLDLLTTSHDLFDVPAIDFGGTAGDAS
jgi:hypothetical protein